MSVGEYKDGTVGIDTVVNEYLVQYKFLVFITIYQFFDQVAGIVYRNMCRKGPGCPKLKFDSKPQ